ncbi:MAG TPA: SoxY-related AACIE arm protein [Burkholderiales bacterium]|jgi:sulfur-oxidizing protein SoxY|nr:SoxY-related AACIE arm protein [Burkholderiales bacterium]
MTTRREFLLLAAASLAAPAANAQVDPNLAASRKAAFQAALRKIVGDAKVQRGRVKLQLPPLIDNGNSVPLSVTVESPMSAADHVKAIHVLTEKNPLPDVVSVALGPRAGRASLATRVRLADTQTVTAIAQMSDGSFWSDSAEVVVTLSACLEEGLI